MTLLLILRIKSELNKRKEDLFIQTFLRAEHDELKSVLCVDSENNKNNINKRLNESKNSQQAG